MSTSLQIKDTGLEYTKYLLAAEDGATRTFSHNYLQDLFAQNKDVPHSDIIQFLHRAQIVGANPANKEIYLIKRKVKERGEHGQDVWRVRGTEVFSYNFFNARAANSGEWGGAEKLEEVRKKFNPITKKWSEEELVITTIVTRLNKGKFPYSAWWDEFAPKNITFGKWYDCPHTMLEKCSFAGAVRRAFPEAMHGMHLEEEFSDTIPEATKDPLEQKVKDEAIEVKAEAVVEQRIVSHQKMEQEEERAKVITQIGADLGVLCQGGTIAAKGKTMLDLCGVSKFKDLETKTLEELVLLSTKVATTLKEKTDRDAQKEIQKTKTAKDNTFKLETP